MVAFEIVSAFLMARLIKCLKLLAQPYVVCPPCVGALPLLLLKCKLFASHLLGEGHVFMLLPRINALVSRNIRHCSMADD